MKTFMSENGPLDSAVIDGYSFGDRLLEDTHFIIKINKNGKFRAETHPDSKRYMGDLNEKKWLKEAEIFSEQNDIFMHPDFEKGVHDDVWIEDADEPGIIQNEKKPIQMDLKPMSLTDVLKDISLGRIPQK